MSEERCVAVAVELGGSKTTVALVDKHGRVHHRCQAKTLRGRPAIATLDPYLRAIDGLLAIAEREQMRVCGIGVSVPGSLDHTLRRPLLTPILPSLNNFPLSDFLEARYTVPARLFVDVDAAILGEQRFGAGQGFHRLLYLTINAVVGVALIIDGRVESAAQQYVGHVSHLSVAGSGPRCSCGKRGCINTLVSFDAVQRMVQRAVRRGDESSLTRRLLNHEWFSLQLLAEEALCGDSVALQIYNEIGRWLGAAIAKYISLFDPNILILSGSILSAHQRAGDLLLTQVRNVLDTHSTSRVCSMVEVVPACLGHDAALIGTSIAFF
jgi:glucokinase